MLHIYNYDQFWDEKNGAYANFYNHQIKDALDNISTENKSLQDAIADVEQIINQTKIQNGLIPTSKTKKQS